jgi:hypothetical protein
MRRQLALYSFLLIAVPFGLLLILLDHWARANNSPRSLEGCYRLGDQEIFRIVGNDILAEDKVVARVHLVSVKADPYLAVTPAVRVTTGSVLEATASGGSGNYPIVWNGDAFSAKLPDEQGSEIKLTHGACQSD